MLITKASERVENFMQGTEIDESLNDRDVYICIQIKEKLKPIILFDLKFDWCWTLATLFASLSLTLSLSLSLSFGVGKKRKPEIRKTWSLEDSYCCWLFPEQSRTDWKRQ